jgi:hypothetical protein
VALLEAQTQEATTVTILYLALLLQPLVAQVVVAIFWHNKAEIMAVQAVDEVAVVLLVLEPLTKDLLVVVVVFLRVEVGQPRLEILMPLMKVAMALILQLRVHL